MNTIYCFWTGTNIMDEKRKMCLKLLKKFSKCNVILVTPDNLNKFILKEHPLHPRYQYLSSVHKADYLRTYFMNFIGGGYSDIKSASGSWIESFKILKESDDKLIIGYKELKNGSAYNPDENAWRYLIGNGAYISKPNTLLTNKWYNEMIELMDRKFEALKANPANCHRDYFNLKGSKYPLGWSELLGQIFHRVCYEYKDKLINTLPLPKFKSHI